MHLEIFSLSLMIGPKFTRLPIYCFLLMLSSNILPNLAPLREIRLHNLGDLDFDLSRSLKVKSSGVIGPPIYDILLVSNSNHMPTSHRLGVMVTQKKISYDNRLSLRAKFFNPPPRTHPYPG